MNFGCDCVGCHCNCVFDDETIMMNDLITAETDEIETINENEPEIEPINKSLEIELKQIKKEYQLKVKNTKAKHYKNVMEYYLDEEMFDDALKYHKNIILVEFDVDDVDGHYKNIMIYLFLQYLPNPFQDYIPERWIGILMWIFNIIFDDNENYDLIEIDDMIAIEEKYSKALFETYVANGYFADAISLLEDIFESVDGDIDDLQTTIKMINDIFAKFCYFCEKRLVYWFLYEIPDKWKSHIDYDAIFVEVCMNYYEAIVKNENNMIKFNRMNIIKLFCKFSCKKYSFKYTSKNGRIKIKIGEKIFKTDCCKSYYDRMNEECVDENTFFICNN